MLNLRKFSFVLHFRQKEWFCPSDAEVRGHGRVGGVSEPHPGLLRQRFLFLTNFSALCAGLSAIIDFLTLPPSR